jgi:omega-hydroxy-beta-dihydromenaquinone-9 sulfotransferase
MESMRKIYETIHLDDFGYCENQMKSFVESQKSFVRLKHEVPSDERGLVTEKLEPFLKHWNYPMI